MRRQNICVPDSHEPRRLPRNDGRCESKLNLQLACAPFPGASSPHRWVYASDYKVWNASLENDYAYLRVIRMSKTHRCEYQEEVMLAWGESAVDGLP